MNLLEQLPPAVRTFREFRALMDAFASELDDVGSAAKAADLAVDPQTCDEQVLARWEKLLNISPPPDMKLELRRCGVLTLLRDFPRFDLETLLQYLLSFCYPWMVWLEVKYSSNHAVAFEFTVPTGPRGDAAERYVRAFLRRILPASMGLGIRVDRKDELQDGAEMIEPESEPTKYTVTRGALCTGGAAKTTLFDVVFVGACASPVVRGAVCNPGGVNTKFDLIY